MERRPRALATANFDPLRQRKGKKYGCDGFRIFSRAHIGRRNEFFKFKKMHPLPGRRAPDLAKQGNARRMSAALRATFPNEPNKWPVSAIPACQRTPAWNPHQCPWSARDSVPLSFGHDDSGAELPRKFLPRGVSAHRDHPFRAHLLKLNDTKRYSSLNGFDIPVAKRLE